MFNSLGGGLAGVRGRGRWGEVGVAGAGVSGAAHHGGWRLRAATPPWRARTSPGGTQRPCAVRAHSGAAAAATDTAERAAVLFDRTVDLEALGVPAFMLARAFAKSVSSVGRRPAEACRSGRCQGPLGVHRSCRCMPCLTWAVFFGAVAAGPGTAAAAVPRCDSLMRSAVSASCAALAVS